MMMSEINTPYVPVDADFVLKDNAGAITIDENYAAQNFWKDVLIRYFRKVSAVIGLVLIILITLFAAIGPGMNEYTYSGQELSQKNFAPSVKALEKFGIFNGDESMRTTTGSKTINYYVEKGLDDVEYWFGSDNFGRDIWTRTWEGARVSLIIAIAAAIIDMVIGMSYGLISGYFGGKVDIIMQRILEIANGIPRLVIVTLLLLVLQPGMLTIIFALMLTEWVGMSRIARAEMLKLKEQEFVLASRTLGAGNFFIIFKEVLPNIIGTNHYTGYVLHSYCDFYRSIFKLRRPGYSCTTVFLRFPDFRGLQQLYNTSVPDYSTYRGNGITDVELQPCSRWIKRST